jgi:hypothetical protein
MILFSLSAAAMAQNSPRQAVTDSLKQMDRDSRQMMNNLGAFLQKSGLWAGGPTSPGGQLATELQNFDNQVNQIAAANSMGQPYQNLKPMFQGLQGSAMKIDQLVNATQADRNVRRSWDSVRNGMNQVNSTFYSGGNPWNNWYDSRNNPVPGPYPYAGGVVPGVVPGFQPGYQPPYQPGAGYPPGYVQQPTTISDNRDDINDTFKRMSRDSQQLLQQLAMFLQMPGRPPSPGGQDVQFVQELQLFQQQVDSLARSNKGGRGDTVLVSQIQQLQTRAQTIDKLLGVVSSAPQVTKKWFDVRKGLDKVTQLSYGAPTSATGSGWRW